MTNRAAARARVEATLRRYIERVLLAGDQDPGFSNDDSLAETGIVDSAGILELQLFVEKTYRIRIPDEDLLPENFDSVRRLAIYVCSRQQGKS